MARPHMVVAYDATGDVIATLDYSVIYDANGQPLGLVDFAAHEEAGGEMTDVWEILSEMNGQPVPSRAKGAKVWPEWIGARAHDFRVELDGPPGAKRIAALVHKVSGHRRERAAIEAAIQARIDEKVAEAHAAGEALRAMIRSQEEAAEIPAGDRVADRISDPTPEPADIRDLVGGPDRPLILDDEGRTVGRSPEPVVPKLPLIGVRVAEDVTVTERQALGLDPLPTRVEAEVPLAP